MEMRNYKTLALAVGFICLVLTCSQREMDPDNLCREFCQLNKGKSFHELFDVSIGNRRVRSVYDQTANQYDLMFNAIEVYDTATKGYLSLPIFKRGSTVAERDSVYGRIEQRTKNWLARKLSTSSEGLPESYSRYVDAIYAEYDGVKTPNWFNYKNVVVEGLPPLGKFITFTLNEKAKVYYLADRRSLSKYWSSHFGKVNRIDEEWYYEITPDKSRSE